MKSVLISIQPKWVEKIANGKKTIEVRKTQPKLKTPFKCYIYCTKAEYAWLYKVSNNGYGKPLNYHGKVIGEFVCDKINKYFYGGYEYGHCFPSKSEWDSTCLTYDELEKYARGKTLYGWHISDLKIYDEPKELIKFTKVFSDGTPCCELRQTQINNWCYVEEYDD